MPTITDEWMIGDVKIANRIVVAPMAGISNPAFRGICRSFHPGLVYTEMISDKALYFRNEKTLKMTAMEDNDHPLAMQIFGHDTATMVAAARFLDTQTQCDIIDVNMGCPVNKVIKAKAGSYLMREEAHTVAMMREVVQAVHKPVTVKMRIGFDVEHCNCVTLAQKLESIGVKAIAVHGRTRSQMYEGRADWSYIKKVKEACSIPIIGNGDIRIVHDAQRMLEETHCDAVMIGRGLLGNPWLIAQCSAYLKNETMLPMPTLHERFELVRLHAHRLCEEKGEIVGMREMRGHAAWYVKGLPRSHKLKQALTMITTMAELDQLLSEYECQMADEESFDQV